MKYIYATLIIILAGNINYLFASNLNKVNTQNSQVLFSDDFEDEDAENITKWTTENLEGWQYWHVIAWNGNPGHCMRFEICDTNQDDWLISLPVDCTNAENLAVSFNYLFNGDRNPPRLYYTNQYNGNASQSDWTEISYQLGENENEWYAVTDSIFNNTNSTIYFGFRYQSTPDNAIFFLLDNFKIKSFIPPAPYSLVDQSEHFEFYTNIPGTDNYADEIKDALEKSYQMFDGHYNVPGRGDYIDKQRKTKVYYTEKEDVPLDKEDDILSIKSGYFNRDAYSIYLCPLDTEEKLNYYGSLEGLAVNTLAGYAVAHRIIRDGLEDYLPPYLIEGFGLYVQGYRPNRDSVISFLQKHPEDLSHEYFLTLRDFNKNSQKDILTAYYEWSYMFSGYGIYWYPGTFPDTWKHFLYYFYTTNDDAIQIKKYDQSENFDIYCSSRDTMYTDSMKVWLERTREFYVDSFQMEINIRYPLFVMYDEQTAMDITGLGGFSGGMGGFNLSPHSFPDIRNYGYGWLLAHEFGHVFNSLMYYDFPVGFYHEGMANFSGYMQYKYAIWDMNRHFTEDVYYYYLKNLNREPTLDDFINNPYLEQGGDIDAYYFGLEFIRYLYETEGLLKIKEFFNKGMDFSVFNQTYEEIEAAYIKRLKLNDNLICTDTLVEIPFNEPFNDFSNGWTKPSLLNPENWQINNDGINGSNCARYYTYSDKNEPVDCWLVSPALNAEEMNQVQLSFDFSRFGDGIELEVLYTDKFEGNTDSTSWTSVKSLEMPVEWGWSNTGEITINNPPDTVFIGLQMKTPGEQHQQFYIDNFEVSGIKTTSEIINLYNNIKVYPNPVTTESVISFQTKTSGEVNLSIFDMQGRKICTILNEKRNAGKHTVPVSNSILKNGVYLCRLTTSGRISTLKMIVTSNE